MKFNEMNGVKMKKVFFLAFVAALISGCAHPLNISPDISAINKGTPIEKSAKNISYYFSEDIEKEVTTPGGGGDKVKYKPYKELDTGIYKVLSDNFKSVVMLKGGVVQSKSDNDLVAEITISTNSSSSSAFTWPPTLFGINISTDLLNPKTGKKEKVLVVGEGRAEFSEFKSNFNLSAKRASEDALNKLSAAIAGASLLKAESSDEGKSAGNSKEVRLRELKRLFDGGLIDTVVYNERLKAILSEGN
jgi:hypothetical protein